MSIILSYNEKILLILCVSFSINSYAKTITLTGVINQPASRARVFYATNNKYYCFGSCDDDRIAEKMIKVLTNAGCRDGMPSIPSNDNNCTIKVNLKKGTNIITKVISAKPN